MKFWKIGIKSLEIMKHSFAARRAEVQKSLTGE